MKISEVFVNFDFWVANWIALKDMVLLIALALSLDTSSVRPKSK